MLETGGGGSSARRQKDWHSRGDFDLVFVVLLYYLWIWFSQKDLRFFNPEYVRLCSVEFSFFQRPWSLL